MSLRKGKVSLNVRRPSPSTISYVVTDTPGLTTTPAKALRGLRLLLRLVVAACCLTILLLELHVMSSCSWQPKSLISLSPDAVGDSLRKCSSVLESVTALDIGGWPGILICSALLWILSRRYQTVESLLVIRGLGIQISTSSSSYLSMATTRFIPTSQIQDIFIHEAFIGFEVKFYLAVIVEGEEEAVVVFPKLLPKRDILEEVWRGAKRTLYQPSMKPGA